MRFCWMCHGGPDEGSHMDGGVALPRAGPTTGDIAALRGGKPTGQLTAPSLCLNAKRT